MPASKDRMPIEPSERTKEMSATEARDAFRVLAKSLGSHTKIFVSLNCEYGNQALSAGIYLDDRKYGSRDFDVEAATFGELYQAVVEAWDQHKKRVRRETTDRMALAIIRQTDAEGACSEAALRIEFGRTEVEQWGADACARADEMAGRGPFSIKPVDGANAPREAA